ncbi:cytochrome-c peroxidase [Solilutibacter silvestris]|nr:cytochrome c peroxidase [Lysobacter silvestris]
MSRLRRPLILSAIVLTMIATASRSGSWYEDARVRTGLLRDAGRRIFSDPSYSASGRQSCANCHDPANRYNPSNPLAVQMGGPLLRDQGLRAPPTLTYLNRIPPYDNHHHDSEDEADNSIDNGPTGGLTWDGRVDNSAQQAAIPLTSKFEMASTKTAIAAAVRRAPYVGNLRKALGEHALDRDDDAFAAVTRALGAFEEDYAEFSPYTSKYDAWLTGHARLNTRELRGLALFEDEKKGACASCHLSRRALDGTPPVFSDYGLIALGVPRNPKLARNSDPAFDDLGACGPERKDKAGQPEYCGLFRTPTLRNVALRKTFFHNGVFHDLRDAVAFYATRDITPERWYSRDARGRVSRYDDLPARYHGNINMDAPFAGQHPGAKPSLGDADIDDIVVFLGTLNDGYLKDNPYRAKPAAATPWALPASAAEDDVRRGGGGHVLDHAIPQ